MRNFGSDFEFCNADKRSHMQAGIRAGRQASRMTDRHADREEKYTGNQV
jgi:hypothetical protein